MLLYYAKIALKGLKRNPILSFLIIIGLAVGTSMCMTAFTMYHNAGWNPIAHRDSVLYAVQLNSWGADNPYDEPNEPPLQLTYRDAMALLQSDIPTRKYVGYKIFDYIHPEDPNDTAFPATVRMATGDFFRMFDVPFVYGGPWSPSADSKAELVCVIDKDANDRLFKGENSVGKWLEIGSRQYKITGVMDYGPMPKFFDLNNGDFQETSDYFIPFSLMMGLEKYSYGNTNSWRDDGEGWENLLNGESVFLQMWVELPSRSSVDEFKSFLDSYCLDQRKLGRFQRPLNNKLTRPSDWLEAHNVVDSSFQTMLIIGILVLLICVVNVVGLILGKFMARLPEVGVLRALGACKSAVFTQHLVEGVIFGLLGSFIAWPLTLVMLRMVTRVTENASAVAHFDPGLMVTLVGAALFSSICAALFPAWRVCRTAPSAYLKLQ